MNTELTKEPMVSMSIKDFATEKKFVQLVPTIRVNTNGYPFITFIDKDNVAENVYFSKKAAKGVNAGQPLTKEMMACYQIGVTKNEAGEERIKLISNSERINLSELL